MSVGIRSFAFFSIRSFLVVYCLLGFSAAAASSSGGFLHGFDGPRDGGRGRRHGGSRRSLLAPRPVVVAALCAGFLGAGAAPTGAHAAHAVQHDQFPSSVVDATGASSTDLLFRRRMVLGLPLEAFLGGPNASSGSPPSPTEETVLHDRVSETRRGSSRSAEDSHSTTAATAGAAASPRSAVRRMVGAADSPTPISRFGRFFFSPSCLLVGTLGAFAFLHDDVRLAMMF